MGQPPRVAVLVDADNVSGEHIAFSFAVAGKHGEIVVKRAFGRVTAMVGKAEILTRLGFSAEVVFPSHGNGKNAADLMLAQYATRLAERRVIEVVALVSSDGDFAPIASGLAEAGIRTLGVGRPDTPAALRTACAHFIAFPTPTRIPTPSPVKSPAASAVSRKNAVQAEDRARLATIFAAEMKSGRVHLSVLGKRLKAEFGDDYTSRFGGRKVSDLVADLDGFAIEGDGPQKEWVIRPPTAQVVNISARPAASG